MERVIPIPGLDNLYITEYKSDYDGRCDYYFGGCYDIMPTIRDLIKYSSANEKEFPVEEYRSKYKIHNIGNLVEASKLAYQLSLGNLENVVKSIGTDYGYTTVDFLLKDYPEEFNKILRSIPVDQRPKCYGTICINGRSSGFYNPDLDFRFQDPPRHPDLPDKYLITLKSYKELSYIKFRKDFDTTKCYFEFTEKFKVKKIK